MQIAFGRIWKIPTSFLVENDFFHKVFCFLRSFFIDIDQKQYQKTKNFKKKTFDLTLWAQKVEPKPLAKETLYHWVFPRVKRHPPSSLLRNQEICVWYIAQTAAGYWKSFSSRPTFFRHFPLTNDWPITD